MKHDQTTAFRRQASSGPTMLEAILVVAIACGLALLIWSTADSREKVVASPRSETIGAVPPAEHAPQPPEVHGLPMADKEQEVAARSESAAAVPPSGGPTTADIRRTPPDASTSYEPTHADGELQGYRLLNVSSALGASGFRDGDLLVRVDGRTAAEGFGSADVASALAPGVIIDVERDGVALSWRLGPSPL